MKRSRFPSIWNGERVQKVIAYCEQQTEDEAVAENEVAFGGSFQTVIEIHQELLPAVRELIAKNTSDVTVKSG